MLLKITMTYFCSFWRMTQISPARYLAMSFKASWVTYGFLSKYQRSVSRTIKNDFLSKLYFHFGFVTFLLLVTFIREMSTSTLWTKEISTFLLCVRLITGSIYCYLQYYFVNEWREVGWRFKLPEKNTMRWWYLKLFLKIIKLLVKQRPIPGRALKPVPLHKDVLEWHWP